MMTSNYSNNNTKYTNNSVAQGKKFLPKDTSQLRLSVGSITELTEAEIDKLVFIMNKHGAVVLTPDTVDETGVGTYNKLDTLFGVRAPHEKKNEAGIVVIDPFQPNSIGVADTEKSHMAHTDESFLNEPSRFMTLQCRVAAADGGGESFLVSGAELLDSVLTPAEADILMKPGMVTVGRTLPGLAEGRVSTQPLIWEDEDGMMHIRWRSHDSYIKYIAPEAKTAFAKMSDMGLNSAHQVKLLLAPNDLMIVDNRANAHGRCPFAEGLARIMWRVNYNGNGSLADRLSCGFQPASTMQEAEVNTEIISKDITTIMPETGARPVLVQKGIRKSDSSAVAA